MVVGVGTDILRISELSMDCLQDEDPFLICTYSEEEMQQAKLHHTPLIYYATRFAGKEAVFKCFGISPEHIKMNEISIINDENGQPHVSLSGNLWKVAKEKADGCDLDLSVL